MFINHEGYWECPECRASALIYGYHKPDCQVVIQKQKAVCSCCQFRVGRDHIKDWCSMFESMFVGCQKFVKIAEPPQQRPV